MSSKYVVVLSGGLDSTTMLHMMIANRRDISSCVSFNYGQRHKKELEYAARTCLRFGLKHRVIDLWSSGFTEALSDSESSLVTDKEVPEGHYAEENMKSTVVPNRNMVMLSIATSIAIAENATHVAAGMHAGDHAIYPDCRPLFIEQASRALVFGNVGFGRFQGIYAPFLNSTKEEIAYTALECAVPLDSTWSCYKGGRIHCGRCGTCVERLEAIDGAFKRYKIEHPNNPKSDFTIYEDSEFWKETVSV